MKNNKDGITLIALVVTIIVLLILAGISVNFITNDDGIIEKAHKIKNDVENSKNEAEERLNQLRAEDESVGENIYSKYAEKIKEIEQLKEEIEQLKNGNPETDPEPEPEENNDIGQSLKCEIIDTKNGSKEAETFTAPEDGYYYFVATSEAGSSGHTYTLTTSGTLEKLSGIDTRWSTYTNNVEGTKVYRGGIYQVYYMEKDSSITLTINQARNQKCLIKLPSNPKDVVFETNAGGNTTYKKNISENQAIFIFNTCSYTSIDDLIFQVNASLDIDKNYSSKYYEFGDNYKLGIAECYKDRLDIKYSLKSYSAAVIAVFTY